MFHSPYTTRGRAKRGAENESGAEKTGRRTKPVSTAPGGGNGEWYVRKGRAGCNMAGAGKARAPNKCGWLKRGGKESCGKRCYGAYCGQHNYQLKKGMKEPQPCRGCGIGLISDYRLCSQCGGKAVKMRRYRGDRALYRARCEISFLYLGHKNTPHPTGLILLFLQLSVFAFLLNAQ